MPTTTCIVTSHRAAFPRRRVSRVWTAIALALIVPQAGCALLGAGTSANEIAEPFDDSAAALEVRSRTLEDVFLRVPGISVTHGNTGRLMVRIQGGASSFAGSVPLFVVDGAPMPSGNIDFLNPKAIVKVEVMKGPANTGIYGGRGSNGVIRITTMRPR